MQGGLGQCPRPEVQIRPDRETPTKLEYELNTHFVSELGMLLWHDLECGQGMKYAYQPVGVLDV